MVRNWGVFTCYNCYDVVTLATLHSQSSNLHGKHGTSLQRKDVVSRSTCQCVCSIGTLLWVSQIHVYILTVSFLQIHWCMVEMSLAPRLGLPYTYAAKQTPLHVSPYHAYSQLAGHSRMKFWIHHKKGFYLHNLFILGPRVQKSHFVLTDRCQIYGLPLTSHVISGQNWEAQICAKLTWEVNGSP